MQRIMVDLPDPDGPAHDHLLSQRDFEVDVLQRLEVPEVALLTPLSLMIGSAASFFIGSMMFPTRRRLQTADGPAVNYWPAR